MVSVSTLRLICFVYSHIHHHIISAINQHQDTKPQHKTLENSQYSEASTQISKIPTRRLHICIKGESGEVAR